MMKMEAVLRINHMVKVFSRRHDVGCSVCHYGGGWGGQAGGGLPGQAGHPNHHYAG